jgi:hypothetical protein
MSFQWAIDNAEQLTINTKAVIGRTQSRDGTVRQTSRGASLWTFDVTMPNGIPWATARQYIEAVEGIYNTGASSTIQISASGQTSWLNKYQGTAANYTGFVASWTQGNSSITLTTTPTIGTGVKFRAGDLIQLKSTGRVYKVAADVAYNSNTVTLTRAIIDATSSGSLVIGPNVTWTVYCIQLPTTTLIARDQVGFSSPYTFVEALA